MQVGPVKKDRGQGGEGEYRYGVACPDGQHEVVVLWNEDGITNGGAEKMLLRVGVMATGTKLDYHPTAGSWRLDNVLEALAPELVETGGDIPKGALRGRICLATIKNKPNVYNGKKEMRPEIMKLHPLEGDGEGAIADVQPHADDQDFPFGENAGPAADVAPGQDFVQADPQAAAKVQDAAAAAFLDEPAAAEGGGDGNLFGG